VLLEVKKAHRITCEVIIVEVNVSRIVLSLSPGRPGAMKLKFVDFASGKRLLS